MKDLTKGNTLRLILGFAFPLAVGNIFQIFYSLVDTRIVGRKCFGGSWIYQFPK